MKSFELIFNYFQHKPEVDKTIIYEIIMKNLEFLMDQKELKNTLKSFVIDEEDYGNLLTFG